MAWLSLLDASSSVTRSMTEELALEGAWVTSCEGSGDPTGGVGESLGLSSLSVEWLSFAI